MKILMPLYAGFNMLDVTGPAEMFHWVDPTHPWTVDLVAEKPGAVLSINRFSLNVPNPLPIDEISRYDALWIPGGDPDALGRIMHDPHKRYLRFIAAQARHVTWVCSVCEGALLAAAAGLLDGYAATTHWAFYPYLQKYFPKVRVVENYPRFVVDRNRLTGGGISSGLDEALKLIELLGGTVAAMNVQRTTQYYPDPPVASAIPATVPMPDKPGPP